MQPLWRKRLRGAGVGGIAATSKIVIVSDRESADTVDAFRCLDAATGSELWKVSYPAKGDLDYGNSPRATPLIHSDLVYLQGAFGHLICAKLASGEVVWKKDLRREFAVTSKMVWGHASSPLMVDDKLIVNPGGPEASVVALEPMTGKIVWQSPGEASAFASFIVATVVGRQQIIGYEATSISGRDPKDGRRLWRHVPKRSNDFNVPTPMLWRDKLILSTENNDTRLFGFDGESRLIDKPLAVYEDLSPDTHSPIVVGDRLFGVWNDLHCLDLSNGLKPIWTAEGKTFQHYTSLIASDARLLVAGMHGEMLLIDATANEFKQVSRAQLIDDDSGVYAHPAIVGDRLYVRGSSDVRCFALR